MHIKRTILFCFLGTVIIICGVYWGVFGSFNYRFLYQNPQYVYTAEDILNSCQMNAYQVTGTYLKALENDAWFQIDLPRKGVIKSVTINLISADLSDPAQIYFSSGEEFSGSTYKEAVLREGNNVISFDGERNVKGLRFDLTQHQGEQLELKSVTIQEEYTKRLYFWVFTPAILLCFYIACFIWINRRHLKKRLTSNEKWSKCYYFADQIFSLAVSDFKSRFSGSYLGIFWGILQPLSTIVLFWFVFQVGFRSQPIEDVPFILWLAAGMIPWNYFYDGWFSGTVSFTQYSYIVKKVVFRIEILPVVKVISASLLNLIFNGILLLIYMIYGRFPGFHIFDMFYFSFCFGCLSLGLSYITATLNVFIKDIGQFLGIILQFLMWMTPMMWVYTMIPDSWSWFYKLNPLHYVINGYRESLINGHWFYYQYKEMFWFWIVTITILICGRKLMKRLRPHFADVL